MDDIKTNQDIRESVVSEGIVDAEALIRKVEQSTVWWAQITSDSPDYTDQYIADLYSVRSDNPDQATYRDVKIYQPNRNATHLKYSWVRVTLDANMVGIILPPTLPEGTGQWKALLLIDEGGTPDWDYWRFQT